MWPFDSKTDIVFKLLFADERNRTSLIALLTAVLAPKEPITSVKVLNPDVPGKTLRDKVAILDLRVRLQNGSEVHVEMQRSRQAPFRERGLFYWGRVHTSQLPRGQNYEELKPTVAIFILDFIELGSDRFHNVFRLLNTHDHEPWSDSIVLHTLELPKVRDLIPDSSDAPVLRWAKFFATNSPEELEQLVMTYPDLQDPKEALERLAMDRTAQHLIEDRERALAEQEHMMRQIEAQGRAEGEAAALRRMIERLCAAASIEVTPERQGRLQSASLAELDRISECLVSRREWPEE